MAPLLEASGFTLEPEHDDLPPIVPPMEAVLQQQVTVLSPSMSPGAQPRISIGDAGLHLPHPIFLIGTDELSLHWLTEHRIRLSALGAVGLVVEADGIADMLKVKRVAGDLPLAAGSGEMLAEQFGLRHYPVLIGPEWIEQRAPIRSRPCCVPRSRPGRPVSPRSVRRSAYWPPGHCS